MAPDTCVQGDTCLHVVGVDDLLTVASAVPTSAVVAEVLACTLVEFVATPVTRLHFVANFLFAVTAVTLLHEVDGTSPVTLTANP